MPDDNDNKQISSLQGEELIKAMEEWADRREAMAEDRTKLAQFRTKLAEERTALAHQRTELAEGAPSWPRERSWPRAAPIWPIKEPPG